MTDDAKLREARAALLTVAATIISVVKSGDKELILLAADTLEGVTASAKLYLEGLEARRTTGMN